MNKVLYIVNVIGLSATVSTTAIALGKFGNHPPVVRVMSGLITVGAFYISLSLLKKINRFANAMETLRESLTDLNIEKDPLLETEFGSTEFFEALLAIDNQYVYFPALQSQISKVIKIISSI